MENLYIEASKSTPLIEYKDRVFSISGQSYPENAFQFYQPVSQWLKEFLEIMTASTTFTFNLEYMNTSSSKCIMDLVDILDAAFIEGKEIVINWYYDIDNESLLDCAEEFKEDVHIPFNIIALEGN